MIKRRKLAKLPGDGKRCICVGDNALAITTEMINLLRDMKSSCRYSFLLVDDVVEDDIIYVRLELSPVVQISPSRDAAVDASLYTAVFNALREFNNDTYSSTDYVSRILVALENGGQGVYWAVFISADLRHAFTLSSEDARLFRGLNGMLV